jgi:lipopolysaccharide transport system ATP-binding protein
MAMVKAMGDLAVRVEDLGKQYRIGVLKGRKRTLSETLAQSTRRQLHSLRTLGRDRQAVPKHDTIWALRHISFEVKRGEVIGVIGRNGAGKSTLLKVVTRIIYPDEGYAQIRGQVGSLLEVGTGFHFELTGRENTYLNGAVLGMRRQEIDRKFDEIVDFSGVEKFIDTPVKHYSSGMYLRLAFAVAAHLESSILLVDEVLAVGDAEFQKKCLGKMEGIAHEGRTVLFVSHQMNAILGLCNRVIVLDHGQIVYDGETEPAVNYYLSRRRADSAGISLAERTDREGSGPFRFESVCVKDASNGQMLDMVLSGQSVQVEIGYRNPPGMVSGTVDVTIEFWSATGQLMFACSNSAVGGQSKELDENGTMTCIVPRWPLLSGIYTISLRARIGQIVSDSVEDAGQVMVENGDYYGTGRLPTSNIGVLVDYQWQGK